MCADCVHWVELLFPDANDDNVGNLLLAATPWPCGTSDDVFRCLLDARKHGCRTVHEAVQYGNECMEREMAAFRVSESPAPEGETTDG